MQNSGISKHNSMQRTWTSASLRFLAFPFHFRTTSTNARRGYKSYSII